MGQLLSEGARTGDPCGARRLRVRRLRVRHRPVRLAAAGLVVVAALLVGSVAGAAVPLGRSGKSGGGTSWNPDPTLDAQAPVIPDSVSVAQAQAWLANALALRAKELATLQGDVTNAGYLPTAVRNSLVADLTTATNGVAALTASVATDTTLAALRSDASSMVVDYRVFSVVQPEVHLTLASEHQLLIASHISHLQPGLTTAIKTERGSAASSTLRNLDAALSNDLSSVQVDAVEVVKDMSSVTTSDYVDSAATISTDAKIVSSDWASVGSARADVRRILHLLAGHS